MSDTYNKLMVEVGNMSKRQTTAVFDYVDEIRAELAAGRKDARLKAAIEEAFELLDDTTNKWWPDASWLRRRDAWLNANSVETESEHG